MYNKQFKSDSARVAFLLCVGFVDYGGMLRHRYCVPHTLIGRYVLWRSNGFILKF
ncbi:DUF3265 domain-containing protein [Vibrio vulnificus]|nr:DUF3265 domain-containing protein [Vibrio vulnificus]